MKRTSSKNIFWSLPKPDWWKAIMSKLEGSKQTIVMAKNIDKKKYKQLHIKLHSNKKKTRHWVNKKEHVCKF